MEIITYTIVGFEDKNKMATFHKENYTEVGSKRVFNKMVKSGKYQCVVRRKETTFDDCLVELSKPVEVYEN